MTLLTKSRKLLDSHFTFADFTQVGYKIIHTKTIVLRFITSLIKPCHIQKSKVNEK